MTVTFLTPTLELHGGTLILANYANYLVEQGHEVTIISPNRGHGLPFDDKIIIKTYPALSVRYLDTVLFQLPYWRQVLKLVEDCDFLIPIYTPLLWPVITAKLRKKLKAKIVLIGQEAFEMPLIGAYNRFLLNKKKVKANLSQVAAVSEPIAGVFRQLLGIEKVTLITNGIDLELFKPRKLPREQFLLFVGRPVFPKGYALFKAVAQALQHENPGLQAKVISPDLEVKDDNGITWVPFESRQQLAELYNQAVMYICASTGESFGLPALEAMASHTPVITTATIGSTQYARNEENCLVVPIGDGQAMLSAARRLLNDKALVTKLTEEGLKTAQKYDQKAALVTFAMLLTNLYQD